MTRNDFSTKARFAGNLGWAAPVLATALVAFVPLIAAPLRAEVNCSLPGRKTPAVPVPECVNSQGDTVSCGTPGRIKLWPNGFAPASPIPLIRDSTDRIAGKTIPGRASGHEIFSSLDVVTVGGISRRLYVAYNAGLQAWSIDPQVNPDHPADPLRLDTRDGWSGEFLEFPKPSEVLNFIEDINALNVSSTIDVVAVAGYQTPVGLTLWEFNTSTKTFRQLYQDKGIHARQVRLIKLNGGTVFAIVGADEGLAVYNVTAARALSSPCLDNQGSACTTVFRGYVTQQARQYIDAIHVAGNDRIYVSASNGTSFQAYPIELWELADPQNPSFGVLRMSESRNAAGSALFRYDGHHYLAFVEEEAGVDKEKLRVLLIDGCVQGLNCSIAGGSAKTAVSPISLDPTAQEGADYGTTRDLLTYSEYDGKPYLYYGVATGGLRGPDFDQLFDLGNLRPPSPSPLTALAEVTAGGGSYTDPCSGAKIRYWSHYYSRNAQGLNDMLPRIGKLSTGGFFYRAAATILDVHVLGDGVQPGVADIETKVTVPKSEYWMSDVIPYTATASGDCSPSPLLWEWSASSSRADVSPGQINQITSTASYSFDCTNALGRCPNALVTVQADNGAASCSEALLEAAILTVKDPEIAIVDAGTGVTDTYEECQTVPFSATLAGRGPVWWEWRIGGEPLDGCSSTYSPTGDVGAAVVGCEVPAGQISSDTLFRDSFESGSFSAWVEVVLDGVSLGSGFPTKAAGPVVAELHVWDTFNKVLPPKAVKQVQFTIAASGTPAFSGAAQETVNGSSATLTHAATNATSWAWEIRDPAGSSTCTFPVAGTVSCHKETTQTAAVTHVWLAAGTYEYRVKIANCGLETATRNDQVTVEAGVQPNVQLFNVKSGGAVCSGNTLSGYTCKAGCQYDFAVKMAEVAAYTFKFDWTRTSSTATPAFATENAVSNDVSKREWYFKHTFSQTGSVYPIVRGQNGAFTHDKGFIAIPITVVASGGGCP